MKEAMMELTPEEQYQDQHEYLGLLSDQQLAARVQEAQVRVEDEQTILRAGKDVMTARGLKSATA